MYPTMSTSVLTLSLSHKRDLLRVRQAARQAADLLGFAEQDRTLIAAAAFDLACQAVRPTGRAGVCFEIAEDCLVVVCTATAPPRRKSKGELPPLRLSKRLPASAAVPREDVRWMLRQLVGMTPVNALEELRKANQELLRTLMELVAFQAKGNAKAGPQPEPSAA